jgi:hypothetical protein
MFRPEDNVLRLIDPELESKTSDLAVNGAEYVRFAQELGDEAIRGPLVNLWGAETSVQGVDLQFHPVGYAAFRYSLIRPSTARRRLSRTCSRSGGAAGSGWGGRRSRARCGRWVL